MTQRLSVERLFGDPPLFRNLPTGMQIAPDGCYFAFLRTAEDDRERLDLWRCEASGSAPRCWVRATQLSSSSDAEASAAEKAERERRRQFSAGITSFALSPDGQRVLLCADGAGFVMDTADESITRITPEGTRQTQLRFSPAGNHLSYVREGNLYCYSLDTGTERALTTDANQAVAYGVPDFIAAEEMHRFDGHWWSPDESLLAYTRVDESPVAISQRFEISASSFDVIEQRYPYTGEANARVDLLIQDLRTGTVTPVTYAARSDDYLARVGWANQKLAVQVQQRDQKQLTLSFADPQTGSLEVKLAESAKTWVDLHNNFRCIDDERFIWTSERDGSAQLYLYDSDGPRKLTSTPGRVSSVMYADEQQVLYLGWLEDPTEQHLYRVEITSGTRTQLTDAAGWHDVVVAPGARWYVDRYSALEMAGHISVATPTGDNVTVLEETIDQDHGYFPYRSAHRAPILGSLEGPDGSTLYYRLTKPDVAQGRHPVVVSVYGGPGVQRVRNEWPPLTLQLFAQRGYGVLELDNRGSSNRERAFQDPIYGQLGEVEVADQVRGAEFLCGLDWVDPQRIGVFGHSYGGYMAVMCMAKAPHIFQAGVSVAPVSDWCLYDTHYTERYLSTPTANPEGYRSSAVFPYLENLRGSLLLIHGMADDNVLFTHSTKLYAALQQANQRFEMMTYPGSKHALQEQSVSVHRFELILDFFERNL